MLLHQMKMYNYSLNTAILRNKEHLLIQHSHPQIYV